MKQPLCPVIEENGVRLKLNIVDTPGYGDQVNNENWYAKRERNMAFELVSNKRTIYKLGTDCQVH